MIRCEGENEFRRYVVGNHGQKISIRYYEMVSDAVFRAFRTRVSDSEGQLGLYMRNLFTYLPIYKPIYL